MSRRKWLLPVAALCGVVLAVLTPNHWPWWRQGIVFVAGIAVFYGLTRLLAGRRGGRPA